MLQTKTKGDFAMGVDKRKKLKKNGRTLLEAGPAVAALNSLI